jgi:hypothetical protein
LAQLPNDSTVVQQNFHGSVGNVAGRDFTQNNITSVQLLLVLETAVKQAANIPEQEKPRLLQRIRGLMEEPYISGLATSAIFEALKAVITHWQ